MSIATTAEWEARGRYRELCGHRVFTVDAPSIGPEEHEPLLILHGFPTSSFDYVGVLDPLRAGELLARRAEGSWPVEVTRRVITNGSIYIEQARLTNGQQLLLSLPDEKLPPDAPLTAASITRSLRETYSPSSSLAREVSPDDHTAATVEQIMRDDGHLLLSRLIRYIEERRKHEARFTGAIESDPSPLHIVWGMDDPIAVPSMVDTLLEARPDATVVQLDGVGHYPMVEAPALFLAGALLGLRG